MRHERVGRRLRLEVWAITLALNAGLERPAAGAAPSPDPVRGWIHDLDDDRFEVREAASRNLVLAGHKAIPGVAAAAAADSLEVLWRGIAVLRSLSASSEERTAA